jgi:hypothetical protein
MRKALNENPLVQAAAIGVLALLVGFMLLTRMGGGSAEEAPPASPAPATDAAAAPAGTATPAPTDPATAAPAGSTAPAPATPTGSAPATDFTAGPGLPKDVANAYDDGKAVALLVVNDRGIDDRFLKATVEAVGKRPDVALFVTDVKNVSKYSRITNGADLNRTPALLVIRPKSETEGPMPTVVVSYGFRGAASVTQAIEDALYKGPEDLPYHP